MSEYRTREQYWDYKDYLQHREGNCYYNKGLDLKETNPTEAVKYFKLALKEDPKDQDFIRQLQLLSEYDTSCTS